MKNNPTIWFWNFAGFALIPLSFGVSWSLIRASNFKVETATQKLEVNRTLDRAKKTVTNIQSDRLPASEIQKLEQVKEEIEAQQQEILSDEEDPEDSPE